ncbi:uncharacterized protein LOC131000365 [Salvia miltiorrhiza]|uniref:uncharacterized protein LOC131000365 n=1 Tax=Salvia miltiorrhiza TaxID=226208 RepID=UPI0025AD5A48|nr:uncharacterized protein LOC131000365 [Salvia miltiorrhiza]
MENHGAAAEGGRILATTFLSLLLPLSFLLLARLSAARYFSSAATVKDHQISFLTSLFLRSDTTLILSFLVIAVAVEALVRGFNGDRPSFKLHKRRRLCVGWVLIFLMQVCLSLGIHRAADVAELSGFAVGNLVSPIRVVFVLGLHEMTVFWRRSVVAPVVDETVIGFSREGFGWVEEVVLAAGFGNLWWRRLRDEAEALAVLPWARAELEMDVEAADAVGLVLYYLTVAIGGVRVIKGFSRAAMWISGRRRWEEKKGVNAAVIIPV